MYLDSSEIRINIYTWRLRAKPHRKEFIEAYPMFVHFSSLLSVKRCLPEICTVIVLCGRSQAVVSLPNSVLIASTGIRQPLKTLDTL